MISKDKITEFFCIADDFCKELEKEFAKAFPFLAKVRKGNAFDIKLATT